MSNGSQIYLKLQEMWLGPKARVHPKRHKSGPSKKYDHPKTKITRRRKDGDDRRTEKLRDTTAWCNTRTHQCFKVGEKKPNLQIRKNQTHPERHKSSPQTNTNASECPEPSCNKKGQVV
ncbi:hypothetical protein C1H46_036704 [Malus baccata]|uniref:Uncharacterized protein n=1 Tax=Malus baccata TaxID=106549 RepID=A0A540KUA2_MALBA|nr:hypothetical protein C1H46_036704 [Malus baccata]